MPKHSQPRRGSLQFWPRKRAGKTLPSVNWKAVSKEKKGMLGFICYKAGMGSALVRDNTEHSMTKGQKIIIPATVLECPPLRIFSVRFYKGNKIVEEVFIGGEKELKKRVKISKKKEKPELDIKEDYDNVRVIVHTVVNKTSIKKTPDIAEIALGGTKEEQLDFVKNSVNKELTFNETFQGDLVDVRGVTKGKGTQGPVKRFGISLRFHKAEKGVRKVGSIGPWHPARVTFRVPMAGQTGFFSRVVYNSKAINKGKISEKDINPKSGFKHYGKIKTDYLILRGSVQGPVKRQLIITHSIRGTKKQSKKNFEFLEIR
jgi:large subunit ribosomal protein L3